MMMLTPVVASNARMLRPSRPMIRPFMSSDGNAIVVTVDSAVCSEARRWMARVMMRRARPSASSRALVSSSRTVDIASRLASSSMRFMSAGLGFRGRHAGDPLELLADVLDAALDLTAGLRERFLFRGQLASLALELAVLVLELLLALIDPLFPAVDLGPAGLDLFLECLAKAQDLVLGLDDGFPATGFGVSFGVGECGDGFGFEGTGPADRAQMSDEVSRRPRLPRVR